MRRPSGCATGHPSPPRALGLGATLSLRSAAGRRGCPAVRQNTAGPQWRYGAMGWLLRPPARAYRGLLASASLSMARSVCVCQNQ